MREAPAGIAACGLPGEDDVVADPERRDVTLLGLLSEGDQRLARGQRSLGGKMAADIHRRSPLRSGVSRARSCAGDTLASSDGAGPPILLSCDPDPMNLLRPLDRDVVVNGLRLHVLDWGGGDRTPLVLLHGFTGHAHAWDTLSIALQPHFHVYAVDQRGHGDSDPADVYNAIASFDDISGVVDQLGLPSLVLVGLSMGGRNAMYFTSKRPDRVQKLVIVDIGPEISKRAAQP